MDFELINSKENKIVKLCHRLMSSSSDRKKNGLFLLEGLRLCSDAAINGYTVETLIVSDSFRMYEKLECIEAVAKRCIKMPENLFKTLCDTVSPQGVLCVVKLPETVFDASDIPNGRYIVLEETADPSNLGAIARTAEALGISGLIVSSKSCDPFSPKSQRAAMGALLRLPLYISNDIFSDVALLGQRGFKRYASVVADADCDIQRADYSGNTVVLIGNEANGLSDEMISICDKSITITMKGRSESLNAAAAASIIMWEMSRSEV